MDARGLYERGGQESVGFFGWWESSERGRGNGVRAAKRNFVHDQIRRTLGLEIVTDFFCVGASDTLVEK